MAQFADLFSNYSFVAALTALVVLLLALTVVALYVLYQRERYGLSRRSRRQVDDLTNTKILFQTMRDILDQQKELARKLNVSLDRKILFIKQVVDAAVAELDALRAASRELATQVRDTQAQLSRIDRGFAQSARNAPPQSEPAPDPQPQPATRNDAPALQAIARPEPLDAKENLIDHWTGLDFAGHQPDPDAYEVPETEPETPEDADVARDAFRALLNLESVQTPEEPAAPPAQGPTGGGNGRARSMSLQARVCEYSDAGMSVAQIARELGLGKGEVRLILGLRQNKER